MVNPGSDWSDNWASCRVLVRRRVDTGQAYFQFGHSRKRTVQTNSRRVDGDIQQVKATVNVLQAQILIQKYSVAPVKD